MAGTSPIKLGSALGTYLVFESSSNVTTSVSGIQSVSVKALWADGSTIWTKIPAAGTSFSTVFGHAYLPSDFKVDRSKDGTIDVEYLDGRVARVTFQFKRPDPGTTPGSTGTSRQVFVDSVFNYKSVLGLLGAPLSITASGTTQEGIYGFAEPTCTVKYNTPTPPAIGGGNLSTIYALPGDSRTGGFPVVSDITIPFKFVVSQSQIQASATGIVTLNYVDATGTLVTTNMTSAFTVNYQLVFKPNALGWQLTKLKYDPVAGATTYDVEEDWRNFYFYTAFQFISLTKP